MRLLKYKEFINEGVSKWKRSWVGEDWNRELGSSYRPDEILEYVTTFHDNDNFDDTDFYERVNHYEEFILKMIYLDDLDLEEFQLDDWKVDEYVEDYKDEGGKYPPIVVGETEYGYTIIDGLHRANALKSIGKDKIKAYVGTGTPDYLNESMINEVVNNSKIYPYKKGSWPWTDKLDSKNAIEYIFENNRGTQYTVRFKKSKISLNEYVWVRSFYTETDFYNLTGEKDTYGVLNTISKITVDFLFEYDVDKLIIEHLPTDKEYSKDKYGENKRGRVNKIFLQRYLPDNYDYKLDGYLSIITKKINESNEFDFEK